MTVDFTVLEFTFSTPPLVVGGKAMEYYQLRTSGPDTDCIITEKEYQALANKYPQNTKNLFGDFGVVVFGFEMWNTIRGLSYEYLSDKSILMGNYNIISLEKLLVLKTLAIDLPKYEADVRLISKKINTILGGSDSQFSSKIFQK